MGRERVMILGSAAGLATGWLAGASWAQPPAPPAPPPAGVVCRSERPLRHFFRHARHTLQDNLIGYPEEFVEPPAGFYVYENFAVMKAKADPHKFTLYRSDFLPGSDRLNPNGAGRFNLMTNRLNGWVGPITVEWSPDEPGLAEARRAAVLGYFQASGLTVFPERVVIWPSPFPGTLGPDAVNFYGNLSTRNQAAGATYSLSPNPAGSLSSDSGGGR